MPDRRRRWWPVVKAVVSLAILFYIGKRFAHDLQQPQLYTEPLRPGYLILAGACYLAGLGMAAVYWRWLLTAFGQPPALLPLARAYYVGQLGKYVPGKALALFLRAGLSVRAGVSPGLAALTAFYEVLTTMASGALLALVIFLASAPDLSLPSSLDWSQAWVALVRLELPEQGPSAGLLAALSCALTAVMLVPILPGVFNRLVDRLSFPFRGRLSGSLPRFRNLYLLVGLLLTAVGWLLMGLGVALTLQAVPGAEPSWRPVNLLWLVASLSVSYVAGFVVLIAPGGLGVREVFLTWLLTPWLIVLHHLPPMEARGKVVLVVLLLRLVWTVAEVLLACLLYLLDSQLLARTNTAVPITNSNSLTADRS